ncbi:MAG: M48 family metallopeptidase [Desulfovibrio sp.]|jgi:putative metalloprotease|nr:M48 family metallopeptidase [Desulfovibrio sp.]
MLKRLPLFFALVGLLSALAACDLSKGLDAAGDAYKSVTLSDAEIQQLGRDSAAQLDAQNPVAQKGDPYARRLNKIMGNLRKEDGLTLNFKVYKVKDVNAFALPDGSVRVFAGLLDLMKDDNEVLFVLGHEIGHVKNGDSKDRFKLVYATSAARKSADAAGGTASAISKSALADLGEAFIHAQYSQKQEYEADAYGYQILKKYKKNTAAAVAALRALQSLGGSGGMLSSHPDSGDRADRIQKMIDADKK